MDFHLLSDVRREDGAKLGELRRFVYDPDARRLISLVVQEGNMAGHAVLVPMDAVSSSDDDAVYVSISSEQLDRLEPYAYGVNLAPPPADLDPETHSADLEEELLDVPDVAPVGAAQGITSIAYTPIVDIQRNIPENAFVIDDSISVWATDGELGKVERLFVNDQTGEVTGIVVEKGLLFSHAVEVSPDWIASLEPDRINLNVSASEMEALNQD